MRYLDGFRQSAPAPALVARLAESAARLQRPVRLMEVCGSHTMAIARHGLRELLPPGVSLLSGPGCPVCVTGPGYVDAALELAGRGVLLASFGDMLRAPGSRSDLMCARAEGADVHVVYSPSEALELARQHPAREVVFLAIGFETTTAPLVALLQRAQAAAVPNLSLLTAFKAVPPALDALLADPEVAVDGFLCPAHVSAIIGADAYLPYAARGVPCVVAGFEPLDILLGLVGLVDQLADGRAVVDNQYERVVRPAGNARALALMGHWLQPIDADWRGLGVLPASGLGLQPWAYSWDAARRHQIEVPAGRLPPGCKCGAVLKGQIEPPECKLFGRSCTPSHPVGPCMVSSEGSCAARFKYEGAA